MKCSSTFFFALFVFYAKGENSLWECNRDDDCFGGTCSANFLCECPPGQILSVEKQKCLDLARGYGDSCVDDVQCAILQGHASCTNEVCKCSDDSHYIRGKCVQSRQLDQSCDSDDQCYNGYDLHANVCKDNICSCRDGYERRGEYDCRFMRSTVNEKCGLDFDCKNVGPDAYCENYSCKLPAAKEMLNGIQSKEISNTLAANFNNASVYATACTSDSECDGLANAYCSKIFGECLCKRGFALDDKGVCKAELGTVFEGDKSNCFGGVYKDNACFCEGQTGFNTENLRSCKKLANHKTKGCTAQESCYLFGPHSFCDSSKLCACKAGYSMNSDNWCVQLFCSTNEDCAGIEHSFCDQKNGCTCEENYFMVDGKCQTTLGAPCAINEDCYVENSMCDRVCRCNSKEFYVQNDQGGCTRSIPLGVECASAEECGDEFAECTENVCTCKNTHIDIAGICHTKKRFGEFCSDQKQCTASLNAKAICQNSICTCSNGHIQDGELSCKKSAASSSTASLFVPVFISFIAYRFM